MYCCMWRIEKSVLLFFCLKRGSGAIYSLKGSKEARLILRAGKEKGEDAYE